MNLGSYIIETVFAYIFRVPDGLFGVENFSEISRLGEYHAGIKGDDDLRGT